MSWYTDEKDWLQCNPGHKKPEQHAVILEAFPSVAILIVHWSFFSSENLLQLSYSSDGSTTLEDEHTISNLYDFCESTRPAAASLPIIVKRLKALKLLHQEAASLTSRLDGKVQTLRNHLTWVE